MNDGQDSFETTKDTPDVIDNTKDHKDKSGTKKDGEYVTDTARNRKDNSDAPGDRKHSSENSKDKIDGTSAVKNGNGSDSAPNEKPSVDMNPQAWSESEANPKNRPCSPQNDKSSRSGSPAKAPKKKKDGELPSQDRSSGSPAPHPPPQAAEEPAFDKPPKSTARILNLNNISNGSKAKPTNPGKGSLGWAIPKEGEWGGGRLNEYPRNHWFFLSS